MEKVIFIRVDGNNEIGFGHLIRMKALARQLEKRGAKVMFLSRNPENVMNYRVKVIKSKGGSDAEDQEVEDILQRYGADMLIIDSYAYNQSRLNRIASLELLSVYIDDMNLYEYNLNFVVNGNLYAPSLNYRGKAIKLLGSEYLLLREDFTALPARIPSVQIDNVLITFGAADMENVTPGLLKVIFEYKRFSELEWHVVIGPVFKNVGEIEALAKERMNVHIYHSPNIKNLMNNCDIATSAAGSTTYELAACGIPVLLIVVADNQLLLAEEAERQGIAINLGWYHELKAGILYKKLDRLIENYAYRKMMIMQGQSAVDGRGAERVADLLINAI